MQLTEGGRLVVVDATEGDGAGLSLVDSSGASSARIELSPGDSFTVTDGRHVSVRYRFVRVKEARAVLEERTWHRPPDGPTEEGVREISVGAY